MHESFFLTFYMIFEEEKSTFKGTIQKTLLGVEVFQGGAQISQFIGGGDTHILSTLVGGGGRLWQSSEGGGGAPNFTKT